jgi:hypothetical protein
MQVRRRSSASGETERAVLGHEGGVDVVDVLGALTVGEQRVEKYDGAAVHDEADLVPEGVVPRVGEIGKRPREQLAGERNVVRVFQSRNDESRWWTCCYPRCCRMQHQDWHRYRHMHDGYDEGRNRLPCGYGYELGEGVERHFGLGSWEDGEDEVL